AGLLCAAPAASAAAVDTVKRMLARYPGDVAIQTDSSGCLGRNATHLPGGLAEHDGLLVAVDGRIVNAPELRTTLPSIPAGDAVLIASLIRRHGVQHALAWLAGDFALAALDPAAARLYLARDRFGVRPLYWCRSTDGIGFASQP